MYRCRCMAKNAALQYHWMNRRPVAPEALTKLGASVLALLLTLVKRSGS